MKTRLCEFARELGFDGCRVTTADPPASVPQFRRWLDAGRQGTLSWLARGADKRADLSRVLPGVQSVVTLAVHYSDHEPAAEIGPAMAGAEGRPRGWIARYARFQDYHKPIAKALRRLSRWMNDQGGPGMCSIGYVDTGPVLERDLAQRAGLGFVGKHTGLIRRGAGVWCFLAEILTTLPLEPDPAEPNHCGRCTRCLRACPTGALVAPFQLDARRCLAYWTIESPGTIPIELRPALGNRIFGCDTCLAVCPWNRFAQPGRWMAAMARPDLAQPDLLEFLVLDEAGFRRRFGGTPLERLHLNRLQRNVCVALGNRAGREALPGLRAAATGPDQLVAEHANWAIGQIEHPA